MFTFGFDTASGLLEGLFDNADAVLLVSRSTSVIINKLHPGFAGIYHRRARVAQGGC